MAASYEEEHTYKVVHANVYSSEQAVKISGVSVKFTCDMQVTVP